MPDVAKDILKRYIWLTLFLSEQELKDLHQFTLQIIETERPSITVERTCDGSHQQSKLETEVLV